MLGATGVAAIAGNPDAEMPQAAAGPHRAASFSHWESAGITSARPDSEAEAEQIVDEAIGRRHKFLRQCLGISSRG